MEPPPESQLLLSEQTRGPALVHEPSKRHYDNIRSIDTDRPSHKTATNIVVEIPPEKTAKSGMNRAVSSVMNFFSLKSKPRQSKSVSAKLRRTNPTKHRRKKTRWSTFTFPTLGLVTPRGAVAKPRSSHCHRNWKFYLIAVLVIIVLILGAVVGLLVYKIYLNFTSTCTTPRDILLKTSTLADGKSTVASISGFGIGTNSAMETPSSTNDSSDFFMDQNTTSRKQSSPPSTPLTSPDSTPHTTPSTKTATMQTTLPTTTSETGSSRSTTEPSSIVVETATISSNTASSTIERTASAATTATLERTASASRETTFTTKKTNSTDSEPSSISSETTLTTEKTISTDSEPSSTPTEIHVTSGSDSDNTNSSSHSTVNVSSTAGETSRFDSEGTSITVKTSSSGSKPTDASTTQETTLESVAPALPDQRQLAIQNQTPLNTSTKESTSIVSTAVDSRTANPAASVPDNTNSSSHSTVNVSSTAGETSRFDSEGTSITVKTSSSGSKPTDASTTQETTLESMAPALQDQRQLAIQHQTPLNISTKELTSIVSTAVDSRTAKPAASVPDFNSASSAATETTGQKSRARATASISENRFNSNSSYT